MTSLTGVNVIQVSKERRTNGRHRTNSLIVLPKCVIIYQPTTSLLTTIAILYKGLGMKPKMILALAGVYGTITFVSNVITTLFLTDQWGRRKYVITLEVRKPSDANV